MIVKEDPKDPNNYIILNENNTEKALATITLDLTEYLTQTISDVSELNSLVLDKESEIDVVNYERAKKTIENGGKVHIIAPSNNDGTLYMFRFLQKHRFKGTFIEHLDEKEINFAVYNERKED
jgi:hypothetical protein